MKRQRELEVVVEEIVSTGKAKNEKGEALYPVMLEPLVMALFNAPDALIDVLRERPGMVLNLIQTNKALSQFLDQFHNLWITLMDELVEREMGTYASEIYPFIMVSRRRLIKYQGSGRVAIFALTDKSDYPGPRQFRLAEIEGFQFRPVGQPYYVIYHDPLTLLYFELLEKILKLNKFFVDIDVPNRLIKYIGAQDRYARHIVKFVDFLLVDKRTRDSLRATYDLKEMRSGVSEIALLTSSIVLGKTVEDEGVEVILLNKTTKKRRGLAIYPSTVGDELLCVQELVVKLQLALADPNLVLEPIVSLALDKNLAIPYRTLLYDVEQGLYPTQEAQKDFFVLMFNELADIMGSIETIEKYGQSLNCVICHCETHSVDPLLMRAFCTDDCHSQYLGHSLK